MSRPLVPYSVAEAGIAAAANNAVVTCSVKLKTQLLA